MSGRSAPSPSGSAPAPWSGAALALLVACAACGPAAARRSEPLRDPRACGGAGEPAARPAGYDVLAWSEEFDGPGFPAALSRVGGLGFAAPWDDVAELQRFEPERARVVRGALGRAGAEIGALELAATWDVAAGAYASGEVVSSASHCPVQNSAVPDPCGGTRWGSGARFASTPTQGVLVEACARLPLVGGSWPAIWILRDAADGVPAPELDVVEAFPGRAAPFCQTAHVLGRGDEACTRLDAGEFHAFAVLWDPAGGRVDFFVDGARAEPPAGAAELAAAWADAEGAGHPAYLVLTHALSTVIAGDFPAAAGGAAMLVDYVRVYTNGPEAVVR